jgi:hypothetical protein
MKSYEESRKFAYRCFGPIVNSIRSCMRTLAESKVVVIVLISAYMIDTIASSINLGSILKSKNPSSHSVNDRTNIHNVVLWQIIIESLCGFLQLS